MSIFNGRCFRVCKALIMQSSESLPALTSQQQSSILVEDNVPGFVQSLIRDFLRNRGFEGTLRAFDYELKNPGQTADGTVLSKPQPEIPIVPSVRAWYEMSEQLDLTNLMERNRKARSSYPTLLEVMTREMVDTNLGKKGMSHLRLGRRRRTSMSSSSELSPPGSRGRSPRNASSTRKSKMKIFGEQQSTSGSTMSLSEMGEEDLKRERALEHKKNNQKEWIEDMNESQRMQVKKFQIEQASKSNTQLEQRSVVDLQREMEKMLVPRNSPPRGRHQFKSAPIENEAKKKRKFQAKQRKKQGKGSPPKKGILSTRSAMDGSDGLGDDGKFSGVLGEDDDDDDSVYGLNGEEPEIHLGPIDAMRKFMFQRSKESWIPWNTRFKMLRKDIAVQKVNNMEQANFFDLLEKNEVSLDYLSLERSKEKYSGKGKTKCALCMQPYLKVNLPMQISFKAIMDLRGQWGLGAMGRGMGLRVPACYNKVAICLYCSQYFDEEQSYRMSRDATGTGPAAPDTEGLGASFLLGSTRRGSTGANRVTVEIFRAGDGRNYPKKGHYAIIHYSAYLSSGMLFGTLLTVFNFNLISQAFVSLTFLYSSFCLIVLFLIDYTVLCHCATVQQIHHVLGRSHYDLELVQSKCRKD